MNPTSGADSHHGNAETELKLPEIAKYVIPRLQDYDPVIPPTPGTWLPSRRVTRVSCCSRLPATQRHIVAVDNNYINIWNPSQQGEPMVSLEMSHDPMWALEADIRHRVTLLPHPLCLPLTLTLI